MSISRTILIFGIFFSIAAFSQCTIETNLVSNGDFENGAIGFTSDYDFNPGNLVPEGKYDVLSNPKNDHNNFSACGDNTYGNGLMMVINGNEIEDKKVWCQTVTVEQNKDHIFSTAIASVHPTAPAVLQFSINGTNLGTPFTASSTTCNWQEFCETWNSGDTTSAEICIVNKNTIAIGNDFALDDIKMGVEAVFLDVDLVSFEVANENGNVRLNWVSASEENHDFYAIERSFDGVHWVYLGKVSGKSKGAGLEHYLFHDHLPEEGINYYRLRMVDTFGKVSYSDIRSIDHAFLSVQAETYPNPANNYFKVKTSQKTSSIKLLDNIGNVVYSNTNYKSEEKIKLNNLSAGAYYLKLGNQGGTKWKKILIKR